jgi:hypothetical protein
MEENALLSNPVNLKELKDSCTFENSDFILKDDIWLKGILLIRSGKYLTESIIDKLMNFGIYEVNIHLNRAVDYTEESNATRELKENYMKTQSILIIDKDFNEIKRLEKTLVNIGFKEKNIQEATNIRVLTRYFQNKPPDYLFINGHYWGIKNYLSYIRSSKTLKNMHIFLLSDEFELQKPEINAENFNARLIHKPVIEEQLKNLVIKHVDEDFSNLLKNDIYIMNNNYMEA